MRDRRWLIAAAVGLLLLLAAAPGAVQPVLAGLLLFLLFASVAATLLLAWSVLDRDVVHSAAVGAAIGFLLDYASGGPFDEWGFASGALVGALLGDVIRDQRAQRLADASYAGGRRWWQERFLEPLWLVRFAWTLALVALSLTVTLGVFYSFQSIADDRVLLGDLLTEMIEARTAWSPSEVLRRGWATYVLLSLAILACWQLWFRRLTPLAADRLLRRIAVLHCLALLLLSLRVLIEWRPALMALTSGQPLAWGDGRLRGLALLLVESQTPLLTMLFTMILLGGRMWRYLRLFGWMPALGVVGWLSTAWLGLHLSYLAKILP
ncbi:hypothetical protein [Lignipirellula cremea]|uniref:Uncharacterized protein n=1 Tax=Lignipirellula cremea TaxID=2528010 RepID=A0A518E0V4_9BACT|nr:hypothetical protein [Lignipirellula cremea]QDU97715.1 hypothetical protein Pla8534_55680 [Lignipirellula cremea]